MRAVLALAFLLLVPSAVFGAEKKPAPKAVDEDTLSELRERIQHLVAAGFEPEGEIATSAIESLSEELDAEAVRPHANRLTREYLSEHRLAQKSWPAVTDCDRLTAAFAALARQGIVARENFSDCQTCGAAEIQEEMETRSKRGGKVRGYVFYHMQDTERAVQGDGVYLSYGAQPPANADASMTIGRDVVAALQAHGLETRWNGKLEQRIHVKMDWKRRR